MSAPVKVTVHDRLEAIGAASWDALHARTRVRSPFLGWVWQTEWVRTFGDGHRLEIWQVEDQGAPMALLPLHEIAPGVFQLIGGTDVSDYLDLIAIDGREEETWAALLEERMADRSVWDLHAIPAASASVSVVPTLAPAFGLSARVEVEERCPVLALPESWGAYLGGLSGKQRHELTRKMRRLAREVPDARPSCAATREAIETRLGDFLDLHRRSRVGKARFMDSRMEQFFRRAAARLAERDMVRLWFLDTSSGPIATFLTLEWDGTVGLYNSGFHPDRAALSPGVVLLGHLIADAIARGKGRFDFLRGEERYKYDFGPTSEEVCALSVGPQGMWP